MGKAFDAARGTLRGDVLEVAIARLAAFWWEYQEHPIDAMHPADLFIHDVAEQLIGNNVLAMFGHDESEQRFAELIAIGQER